MKAPDDNPKTAEGLKKPQLHLVPPIAVQAESFAFQDGAEKYGPYNWRAKGVSVSTYISAARRHLDAYWDGENFVPDSKAMAHHLAAVRACMAILLDARSCGTLNDDRPFPRLNILKDDRCMMCESPYQPQALYCAQCGVPKP